MELTTANRRKFLRNVGLTGLGLAGAGVLGNRLVHQATVQAAAYSDADILNFALNLEYLEAEFYVMASYGTTLVGLGVISSSEESGPTTGGNKVPNFGSSPYATMATALRNHEVAHVEYLRAALGSAAVKKPAINLNALGFGFMDVYNFLKLARIFEDVGVSAYLGAAPSISSSTYLAAAGAILSTEAFHSGAIRQACVMNNVSSPAVDSMDVPPTAQNYFDVDKNALAIPRTPQEVLKIVYGGGTSSGGFFPQGLNGGITM